MSGVLASNPMHHVTDLQDRGVVSREYPAFAQQWAVWALATQRPEKG